jgi:hypothetical protein
MSQIRKLTIGVAVANQSDAIEQRPLENGWSSKSQMRRGNFLMLMSFFVLFGSFCYGQTVVQQQQNVIVNPVVIEKPVYIERYRTVYVDKPMPKRTARKLPAPVQLLGYLWVHTEDLGNFNQQPLSVIANINAQSPFGRNDWRIPTPDELTVMENNADKIGLGDDMYMATNARNGVLRLVSTGKTVAVQKAEQQAEIAKKKANAINEIEIDGVIWSTRNVGSVGTFVSNPQDKGQLYTQNEAISACPSGWRLPTSDELKKLQKNNVWNGNGHEFSLEFGKLFIPYVDEGYWSRPIQHKYKCKYNS